MPTKPQPFAAVAAAALLTASCATTQPVPPPSSPSVSPPRMQSDVHATRTTPLGAPTARDLVRALAGGDMSILHPVDNTSRECPAVGCDQSVVTDRLRVKSFATTGAAQEYAADRGLLQVETIVVEFAPAVPEAARRQYWSQIVQLVS